MDSNKIFSNVYLWTEINKKIVITDFLILEPLLTVTDKPAGIQRFFRMMKAKRVSPVIKVWFQTACTADSTDMTFPEHYWLLNMETLHRSFRSSFFFFSCLIFSYHVISTHHNFLQNQVISTVNTL